jgi:hypothetical protein
VAVRADPVAPASAPTAAGAVTGDAADTFRDRRRSHLSEGRRRRELLSAADPSADPSSSTRSPPLIDSGGRRKSGGMRCNLSALAASRQQDRPKRLMQLRSQPSIPHRSLAAGTGHFGECGPGFDIHVGPHLSKRKPPRSWTKSSTFRCRENRCEWWAGPEHGSPAWR